MSLPTDPGKFSQGRLQKDPPTHMPASSTSFSSMTPWEAAGVLLAIFEQVLDAGFLSRHADTWVQTKDRDGNVENYQDTRIPASSDSERDDFK